ncbi:MAG: hypothetical protein L0Y55_07940, partial [Anaerolineales bacterium]|nr:hypothetical protein [Anaerolineales bacterium]
VELLRGGASIATARAASDAPVEVLRLDRATFDQMMEQAPELQAHIARIAQERVAENVAAQKGGR